MAGPNSAPNGNVRLVSDEVVCSQHGDSDKYCTEKCAYIRYREWLSRRNRLTTGKTSLRRGR